MKRLFAMLLVLILTLSLLPMAVSAKSWSDYPRIEWDNEGNYYGIPEVGEKEALSAEEIAKFKAYLASLDNDDDDDAEPYLPHSSKDEIIGYGCDTKYHWKQCSCGCKIAMELHVDPKDTTDDTCICGYHFSDNADLVTLWVKGCPGIKYFDKNKTEYKLNAYTYKDIKEIKISTRTHDSEATVELPEDLTLKEGENKFEVKVTSENQKVTKIYTLIITKEAAK